MDFPPQQGLQQSGVLTRVESHQSGSFIRTECYHDLHRCVIFNIAGFPPEQNLNQSGFLKRAGSLRARHLPQRVPTKAGSSSEWDSHQSGILRRAESLQARSVHERVPKKAGSSSGRDSHQSRILTSENSTPVLVQRWYSAGWLVCSEDNVTAESSQSLA